MTPQQLKEKEANEVTETLSIHCDFSRLEPPDNLKPNPSNPNLHDENQTRLLCAMLKHQGWREAIIVSNQSGLVVCGHGRLKAAKLLGLKEVPVDLQDFKNEADEVAHMIGDNRIGELSFFDNATLKEVLLGLDTGALDMEVTGYDEKALEDLMTQFHVDSPEDFPEIDENLDTEHKCPKCGYKWSGKAGEE